MPRLPWSDNLSLGVRKLDEQHKHLVRLADGLVTAMHVGSGENKVATCVAELRDYLSSHCAMEEEYMARLGYPGLEEQREAHRNLGKRVLVMQQSLYVHSEVTPEEVLALLKEWLIGHLLVVDGKFGRWLKEHATGEVDGSGGDEQGGNVGPAGGPGVREDGGGTGAG
ncbi:hemerythrin-like metal-binding protein [Desulfovibrio sp. X2]|uniref:bacteriohemerythrin n=1 Tax=Desulfovibrio sp. X2 TaxID=941449 RepID=UPI000358A228|nr:bacteriohemerythrin [Desulfovibrio sp. X2]EPR39851.1 hemerythrin-like metal-binding protein [Desulfovibrio sp. X2]